MFDYTSVSDECIKCGKCKPVCTIFKISQDETKSPRGFIDLLGSYKRGELELDYNAKDIFESCFLCTACVEVCPNSLPTDMIIEQVRNDIRKKYGLAWYKKAAFWFLRHRKTTDLVASLGYKFQSCGIDINEAKEFAVSKIDFLMIKKGRTLPYLAKKSFLKKYPEFIENGSKKKVAIFIGCLSNYSYTKTGDSLVEILKTLNIDIFIPKKQLCCSAPAYFTGDFDTVDYLVKKNIEYFESFIDDVDAIIIPEATCSAMIKIDWIHYLHDQEEWKKRAEKISKKIFMATKWLYDNTEILELLPKDSISQITYHDACHAKKMQKIEKEPRELLQKSFEIVEMEDSNACCGFGGVTMQTEKYDLAKQVGDKKANMIKNTNVNIVSAECSACRMQINDSLNRNNVDVVFKNPIELLAEALNKKKN